LVNEEALVDALKDGKIAGAGLDVYEFIPKITTDLRELENATLLQHIGSAKKETKDAIGFKVLENLNFLRV